MSNSLRSISSHWLIDNVDRALTALWPAPAAQHADHYAPIPEPPLDDAEIIAVRQLIEERFGAQAAAETCIECETTGVNCFAHRTPPAAHTPAAGSSPAGVSDPTLSPPAGHPDPDDYRDERQAQCDHDEMTLAGNCFDCGLDLTLDWLGWAVPAILEVLTEHWFCARGGKSPFGYIYYCKNALEIDDRHHEFESRGYAGALEEWQEHVAPLIAHRIACNPAKAVAALQSFQPTK